MTTAAELLDTHWLDHLESRLDEMVWVWEPAGARVVFASEALRRFGGVDATTRGDEVLLQAVHDSDRASLSMRRHEAASRGAPFHESYRASRPPGPDHPAGRTVWLREQAFALRGPDGRVRSITHIVRDITWQHDTSAQLRAEISRRTDAERSLDDANSRLRALLDTANDAVVTIDEDSRVIDWNNAAQRIFGWTREEAVGQVLTSMIVPHAHRQRHHHGLSHYLVSGHGPIFNRRVETTALRRDGEEFDIELSVWPVKNGDHYTFSSFIRDISRRKQAERALAESEAKYRTVVENADEGILVTAGGRILYANPRALVLAGVDEQTALSQPFIAFIHPEDREFVLGNHMRRLRGEPVDNHYHFRVLHPDGTVLWLEISAVLFQWEGQHATLNFLTDVTLRRQVEQETRNALQRERELSELKSRFVAVASHEFRTPLAAILSSVELLDDYGERLPADERHEMFTMIKNAVARMNDMVDQVMLTSRLEAGSFAFSPRAQRMEDLLIGIATEMDRAHRQAGRVAMACDNLDQPRMLDEQLLRHILVNLLSNAIKYSPPDTPVSCQVTADGDRLRIVVADQGIGIPGADLPRLFETFHRGTNVGNIQGTGIGLHIVRECVTLHGGTISVDSAPGEGTRFSVMIHAPLA